MRLLLLGLLACASAIAVPGAQVAPDSFITASEGAQSGWDGELAPLTLPAAMQKAGVPGVSMAVIPGLRGPLDARLRGGRRRDQRRDNADHAVPSRLDQ
jgi:hypothetical protein